MSVLQELAWAAGPSTLGFEHEAAVCPVRREDYSGLLFFQANHKRNHMDLVEGIWREVCQLLLSLGELGKPLKAKLPGAAKGNLASSPF